MRENVIQLFVFFVCQSQGNVFEISVWCKHTKKMWCENTPCDSWNARFTEHTVRKCECTIEWTHHALVWMHHWMNTPCASVNAPHSTWSECWLEPFLALVSTCSWLFRTAAWVRVLSSYHFKPKIRISVIGIELNAFRRKLSVCIFFHSEL